MKKLFIPFIVVLTLFCSYAVAMEMPDVTQNSSCKYCGMDREKFAHSRMIIEYGKDHTGLCSLHCAALDLANQMDKMPTAIMVGDYDSKELINAENAVWVLGGSAKGVMSKRAKWAFKNKPAAEKFIAEQGGEIVAFEDAIKATYEDLYMDTKMIRKKRQEMKKMKMKKHGAMRQ